MSREQNKLEQNIKSKIVENYYRGVCDHNGATLPKEKRGMAGKGSRFGQRVKLSEQYRQNYSKIFGHD